ncbi:MAG: hypothetical protein WC614_10110 [bacterium]
MKNFLGVALSVLFFAGSAMAEISVGPIVGYGFGTGKTNFMGGTDYEADQLGKTTKDKNLYYSAGQGIKLGLGAAYSIEGISFGLDMGYSMGLEGDLAKFKTYSAFDSTVYTSSTTMKTSYIFVSPTMQIEKNIMGITPFCGFGFTLALMPKSIMTSKNSDNDETVWELSHNVGIGKWGTVGIKYALISGLWIIGEIKAEELSFKASSGKITKCIQDTVDQLPDMTTRDKECEFRDDDTGDTPTDTTKPDIAHTFVTAANSISIRLGIIYSFKIPGAY